MDGVDPTAVNNIILYIIILYSYIIYTYAAYGFPIGLRAACLLYTSDAADE